jgi:hypothetical protein
MYYECLHRTTDDVHMYTHDTDDVMMYKRYKPRKYKNGHQLATVGYGA